MTYFLLSPCILKDSNGEFVESMDNLQYYAKLLGFAIKWLDLKLLIHEKSFYNQLWEYSPPLSDLTLSSYFATNITSKFQSLVADGQVIYDEEETCSFESKQYICVDQHECDLIACCLGKVPEGEALMFVGLKNSDVTIPTEIKFNSKEHTINLIYDPYKTESTILDSSLKIFASSKSCIFPYAEICDFFIKKAETEKSKSAYQLYGDIIAKRNGYSKMPYDAKRYKQDAPCYISRNRNFFISLDDLHGTFEVFDATTKKASYIGEYSFDGLLITSKFSDPNTHKFFKS